MSKAHKKKFTNLERLQGVIDMGTILVSIDLILPVLKDYKRILKAIQRMSHYK